MWHKWLTGIFTTINFYFETLTRKKSNQTLINSYRKVKYKSICFLTRTLYGVFDCLMDFNKPADCLVDLTKQLIVDKSADF